MAYRVAVVCRARGFSEVRHKQGWFSYPVPGLEWKFFPVKDEQVINTHQFADTFDLIFWEDWCTPEFVGGANIPIYGAVVDSNTSPRRRKNYLERMEAADVLLVDQDKLSNFNKLRKPAFRWQYAVNEYVFRPREKAIDVGYHVAKTKSRAEFGQVIKAHCDQHGYSLTMGGGMTIEQYAQRIGAAKIVVHKATFAQCRSHRFFDALASGSCLITDRVWSVHEDQFQPGVHFAEWQTEEHLGEQITHLLESGLWQKMADVGRDHVLRFHTWRTRAEQLVSIIKQTQGVKA